MLAAAAYRKVYGKPHTKGELHPLACASIHHCLFAPCGWARHTYMQKLGIRTPTHTGRQGSRCAKRCERERNYACEKTLAPARTQGCRQDGPILMRLPPQHVPHCLPAPPEEGLRFSSIRKRPLLGVPAELLLLPRRYKKML